MPTRSLAYISLLTLIGTLAWMVFLFAGGIPAGTFEAALTKVSQPSIFFYLNYLNAAFLVTIPATMLMALLYSYSKNSLPDWARLIGVIFVPVYSVLNLFAYLSQITLVPLLVELYQMSQYRTSAELLLRLSIQELPTSTVAFFNGLAYGILGIPSIIFGIALYRRGGAALRAGGVLLALNGLACILGVAGYLMKSTALSIGTVAGGALFLLALFPMTWAFFKSR